MIDFVEPVWKFINTNSNAIMVIITIVGIFATICLGVLASLIQIFVIWTSYGSDKVEAASRLLSEIYAMSNTCNVPSVIEDITNYFDVNTTRMKFMSTDHYHKLPPYIQIWCIEISNRLDRINGQRKYHRESQDKLNVLYAVQLQLNELNRDIEETERELKDINKHIATEYSELSNMLVSAAKFITICRCMFGIDLLQMVRMMYRYTVKVIDSIWNLIMNVIDSIWNLIMNVICYIKMVAHSEAPCTPYNNSFRSLTTRFRRKKPLVPWWTVAR